MDVITHKCPNCGGALTFDPGDQKFHCSFCLSIFTEAEVTAFEQKQKEAQLADGTAPENQPITDDTEPALKEAITEKTEEKAAQMDLFLCPNCGAEIVTDATTAATYCYFCHNPVVLSGRLSGEFLPNKVLPFAIEKEEATAKFLEWAQKKWFVPRDFFDQAQVEKLTGVYFPYWRIDAELDGQLSGTGTSLRIWRVGEIEYTEHKQFAVSRRGKMRINELIKNALSKNVQQKMVTGVQPFPLDKAVDFRSQYLAGFQAEKRDIEYQALKNEVQQELSGYAENLLSSTVNGYTSFNRTQRNIEITKETNHYVLLPVWLVTYRADDPNKNIFYYAMNGQTGKVSGVLPISYKRLGFTSAAIFAVIAILGMIGGYFL
ncbi:TFIIB-type zinc ribbon-containing protein [Enterococcus gallinarum]|uniref:TFIIB-type zinc ribbon-containing protein n=1 Tax=Enterococcus gallinarum TaxID=1353 RepID=UPI0018A8CC69|nr:TFIIB-type zinc ribbon-containing protein [Enterococcus gallinarum]